MNAADLERRLGDERVVPMPAPQWSALAGEFEEMERHATGVAGDLVIIRVGAGLAVVEESNPDERVVRRLADEDEVRRFVSQRLEEYERMWDGCGCKIEYYK